MKTRLRFAGASVLAIVLTGCGSDGPRNPIAPQPPAPSGATVASISVTAAPTGDTTFQMTATARMSDGTSDNITTRAAWTSSDTSIATVTSAGVVTVVRTGPFDVRASYQGVSGSLHLDGKAKALAISGVVRAAAPDAKPVAGASVRLLDATGTMTTTDDRGAFMFAQMPAGRHLVEITKDGYQVWESEIIIADRDAQLTVDLYPTPPQNDAGATATARCNDGSWSWAQTRAEACAANGGIAYEVCPGPLCTPQ